MAAPPPIDTFAAFAKLKPNAPCVIDGDTGRTLSWSEALHFRNGMAHALFQQGMQVGDRCIIYGYNSIEWVLIHEMCTGMGLLAVPMNWHLAAPEVEYIVSNSEAKCVFVGDDFLPLITKIAPSLPHVKLWVSMDHATNPLFKGCLSANTMLQQAPRDYQIPAPTGRVGGSFLYTGGTSGKPKAVVKSETVKPHPRTGEWMTMLGSVDPKQVQLIVAPLYHSAPFAWRAMGTKAGGTIVVLKKFLPEQTLQTIQTYKVTLSFTPPIVLKRLCRLGKDVFKMYNVSSLRSLVVAGAPCPDDTKRDCMELFGPVLHEFYGSSELGVNSILLPKDSLRKPGSCGKIPPGLDLVIMDEDGKVLGPNQRGLLYVKTELTYHNAPEKTQQAFKNGYATVGDIAYLDEEGFIFICDRQIDMILSGGANIYPAEIEQAMHEHPAVGDVAVIGIPDEEYGEAVHAIVELSADWKGDRGDKVKKEIMNFTQQRIAKFKLPRTIEILPQLPRTPSGKLLKRELKARAKQPPPHKAPNSKL